MSLFTIFLGLLGLAGLALLVIGFIRKDQQLRLIGILAIFVCLLLFAGQWAVNNVTIGFKTEATSTPSALTESTGNETTPTSEPSVVEKIAQFFDGDRAETHFVESGVPGCTPVNPDGSTGWKKLFGKKGFYALKHDHEIFNPDHAYVFEGVITGSNPTHTVRVLDEDFKADQANIWDCGPTAEMTKEQLHTLLFEFADKKWQNQKQQGLAKPYRVITPFNTYNYKTGEQPAWAPTVPQTGYCPFKAPKLSDPLGVQNENSDTFVGAPGKYGCDFVVVAVDGKSAVRYHGAIDSFEYLGGNHFWLFDPKLTNEQVSSGITGNPVVENSWK